MTSLLSPAAVQLRGELSRMETAFLILMLVDEPYLFSVCEKLEGSFPGIKLPTTLTELAREEINRRIPIP